MADDPVTGIASGITGLISTAMQNAQAQTLANQAQSFDVQQSQFQTMANQQQALEAQQFNAQQAAQAQTWTQQNMAQAEGFEAGQVQQQQAYETQMSNTAYQRSRADMIAAGLNPMVMAGMGGASTPSVSAASIGAPSGPMASGSQASPAVGARGRVAPVQSLISPALMNSAMDASLLSSRGDNIDANSKAAQAAAGASNASARQADQTASNLITINRKNAAEADVAENQARLSSKETGIRLQYLQDHPDVFYRSQYGSDQQKGLPSTPTGAAITGLDNLIQGGKRAFDYARGLFGFSPNHAAGPVNAKQTADVARTVYPANSYSTSNPNTGEQIPNMIGGF